MLPDELKQNGLRKRFWDVLTYTPSCSSQKEPDEKEILKCINVYYIFLQVRKRARGKDAGMYQPIHLPFSLLCLHHVLSVSLGKSLAAPAASPSPLELVVRSVPAFQ